MKVKSLSRVGLFVTPWTVAHQASLSMGFSRQEYWSGLPCPPPGDLADTGIKPGSPALQADSLPSEPPGKPWVDSTCIYLYTHTGREDEGIQLFICHGQEGREHLLALMSYDEDWGLLRHLCLFRSSHVLRGSVTKVKLESWGPERLLGR